MKKILFITSLTLFFSIQSFSQTVKVDAEIRSRTEFRNGFQEPLADTLKPAVVNNLRTRLNFTYASSDIKAKLSLLDTRTFGTTDPNKTGN
jgi:hypothetical protein